MSNFKPCRVEMEPLDVPRAHQGPLPLIKPASIRTHTPVSLSWWRHSRTTRTITALLMGACLVSPTLGQTGTQPPDQASQVVLNYQDRKAIFEPQVALDGMVASDHYLASRVGANILADGGNAVDAAVATALALAVVLPYAGNLGGGGFALIYFDQNKKTAALDFREAAPLSAHADMFLNKDGTPIPGGSVESTASIGVPGSVAGLLAALETYGTLPRAKIFDPAIALAENGFEVTATLAQLLKSHAQHLYKSVPNRSIFFKVRAGETCQAKDCPIESLETLQIGDRLLQRDLAQTLTKIRDQGEQGFYRGAVADAILKTINRGSGQMQAADLDNYQIRWRKALVGQYRGYDIVTMPAPSSGGVHLLQMLNILSHYDIKSLGYGSASSLHLMTEAARRAYLDRSRYLGDPDFVAVPTTRLLSLEYTTSLIKSIDPYRATPSKKLEADSPLLHESPETTHLSVVDRWNNMVSLTTTLNLNFGSGWMAEGTGVLLNNEMDDFSSKPGVANAFGLVGSQANRIEAGKRPLSSMAPTLLFKHGKPVYATGTPGGSRIITTLLQTIMNVADHEMNIASATAAPRMHHQWLPDRIDLEPGFSPDTVRILRQWGHAIEPSRAFGRVQSVGVSARGYLGYSDPRSADGAAIGTNLKDRTQQ